MKSNIEALKLCIDLEQKVKKLEASLKDAEMRGAEKIARYLIEHDPRYQTKEQEVSEIKEALEWFQARQKEGVK